MEKYRKDFQVIPWKAAFGNQWPVPQQEVAKFDAVLEYLEIVELPEREPLHFLHIVLLRCVKDFKEVDLIFNTLHPKERKKLARDSTNIRKQIELLIDPLAERPLDKSSKHKSTNTWRRATFKRLKDFWRERVGEIFGDPEKLARLLKLRTVYRRRD